MAWSGKEQSYNAVTYPLLEMIDKSIDDNLLNLEVVLKRKWDKQGNNLKRNT